jgi:uncharacterized membrane protein
MNKQEFLYKLEGLLQDFPEGERKEILYDYEEHFRIGIEDGKSEERISKELGDPRYIVKQYNRSEGTRSNIYEDSNIFNSNIYGRNPQTSAFRTVIVGIFLFFLNLSLIGVFIGAYATVVSFFIASFAIFLASLIFLVSPIAPWLVSLPIHVPYLSMVLYAIGLASLGALLFIGSYYSGKFVYNLTINYYKFNIRLIKGYRRGEDYVQ